MSCMSHQSITVALSSGCAVQHLHLAEAPMAFVTLQDGMLLVSEKPETEEVVKQKMMVLQTMWEELESTTQTKAQCLFDANKAELFTQSCADLDKWMGGLEGQIQSDEYGKDLTSVSILLKKQQVRESGAFGPLTCLSAGIGGTDCFYLLQMLENQVEVRQREVVELQSQVKALSQEVKDTDEVDGRRQLLEKKFQELLEPLQRRRNLLLASREVHQFNRDVEDEIVSAAAEVASEDAFDLWWFSCLWPICECGGRFCPKSTQDPFLNEKPQNTNREVSLYCAIGRQPNSSMGVHQKSAPRWVNIVYSIWYWTLEKFLTMSYNFFHARLNLSPQKLYLHA